MKCLCRQDMEAAVEEAYCVMDFLPLGALVVDRQMRIRFFNSCLEFWTGMHREEVLGRPVQDVFEPINRPIVLDRFREIFAGGPPAVFSYHLHSHLVPAPLPDGGMRLQHGVAFGMKGPDGAVNRLVLSLQDITELHSRLQENLRIKAALEDEILRRQEVESRLRDMATKDHLTCLFNRRAFFDQLHVEVNRARRYDQPMSLMVIDLDGFKSINDRWGHQMGDEVLQRFAATSAQELRATDVLARIGGEEFAVILPQTTGQEALMVAQRIRRSGAGARVPSPGGGEFGYSASFGVASLDENMDSAQLLQCADHALYAAKKAGRNRVEFDGLPANPS